MRIEKFLDNKMESEAHRSFVQLNAFAVFAFERYSKRHIAHQPVIQPILMHSISFVSNGMNEND